MQRHFHSGCSTPVNYICMRIMEFLHFRFSSFFVFCVSVKVKLSVSLL